jgi:hypothetical protein
VIGGPAGRRGHHAVEAKAGKVRFVDKNVNHPHRILLGYVVVQTLREQRPLSTVFTFDETLHLLPNSDEMVTQRLPGRPRLHVCTFLHSRGQKQTQVATVDNASVMIFAT